MKPSDFIEKKAHEEMAKISTNGHDIDQSIMMATRINAIIDYLDSQWDIRKDPDCGHKNWGF
jgi:hypothetical protein